MPVNKFQDRIDAMTELAQNGPASIVAGLRPKSDFPDRHLERVFNVAPGTVRAQKAHEGTGG